jgi:hypothetical protein
MILTSASGGAHQPFFGVTLRIVFRSGSYDTDGALIGVPSTDHFPAPPLRAPTALSAPQCLSCASSAGGASWLAKASH